MNFFINAFPRVLNNFHSFGFLYENNSKDESYVIQFKSPHNIKVLNEIVKLKNHGVHLDFIQISDVSEIQEKIRIPYQVRNCTTDKVIYQGSIILFPENEENIKILYSGCNMNCYEGTSKKFIKKKVSRFSKEMIIYLSQNINFDVWIQLGDNIYSNTCKYWLNGQISKKELIEIQNQYYINTYNDIYQGNIMRNCINFMIQDNNDFCAEIGSSDFMESNKLFKKYFDIILENVIKKYTIYIFNENDFFSKNHNFNSTTNWKYSKLVKIGKYELLFHNNIYSLYKSGQNLCCEIFDATEKYLKTNQNNYIIVMSRCLENYEREISQTLNLELYKSNTFGLSYEFFLNFVKLLDTCPNNKIIFGSDNHFCFLKNYGKDYKIYDICTSGLSVEPSLDGYMMNTLSIMNGQKKNIKVPIYSTEFPTFNICFHEMNQNKIIFVEYIKNKNEFKYSEYSIL
jgi:hypothetical protein